MQSLGWRHFYARSNGNASSRCCPKCEAKGGPGRTTDRCLKAFSGCLKPGRAGAICQKNIHRQPPAGDDCEHGRSGACGWKSGAPFCANSMSAGNWTGVRALWTGVLLPLKRGLRSWKDQAGKGNEVDGGGRRLGYSSGKSTCQRKSLGSKTGGIDPCAHQRAAQETSPNHSRPRLRQRSSEGTSARAKHPAHCPTPQRTHQGRLQRRTLAASLSQTLESRAYLRLAGQLPPPRNTLRISPPDVSGFLSSRLPAHYSQALMKPLLIGFLQEVIAGCFSANRRAFL